LARRRLDDDAAFLDPASEERLATFRRLERGHQDERLRRRPQMVRERFEKAGRGSQTVGSSVEREIHPRVRVALGRGRRKVGRVREDPVESAQAGGKVRTNDFEGKSFGACDASQAKKGARVPIRRDDRPARSRRREAQRPVPAADVEEPTRSRFLGERKQELRVLPDGIDGALGPIAGHSVGS
jgi:hypothetical protein